MIATLTAFIAQIQTEMRLEVIDWSENRDQHFLDLLTPYASVCWLHHRTLDILYSNSRDHIRQRFVHIPVDFSGNELLVAKAIEFPRHQLG